MSTHHSVTRISTIATLSLGLSFIVYSTAISIERPGFDLPSEIRALKKGDLTEPPQTILDLLPADSSVTDTGTAVVWIKFKFDRKEGNTDFAVVFSSHPNVGFEDKALTATREGTFLPPRMSSHKRSKWVYHEVVFNKATFRAKLRSATEWERMQQPGAIIDSTNQDSVDIDRVYDSASGTFVVPEVIPEPIYWQPPEYSRRAKDEWQTGTVWIKVQIDESGSVIQSRVAKTSGYRSLDNSALEAALKNRFKPGKLAGKPVRCWITYKVDYSLEYID